MANTFFAIQVKHGILGTRYKLHGRRITEEEYERHYASYRKESEQESNARLGRAYQMIAEFNEKMAVTRGHDDRPKPDVSGWGGAYRNENEYPPYLRTANWGNCGVAQPADEPWVEERIRRYRQQNAGRPQPVGCAGYTERDLALLPDWEQGDWGAC